MNTDIELRHLRYFVAVAEELHFGRAAQRLHLAQPPLSQQIRKLEEIIGFTLFTRTSRAVKLTAVGEVFLQRAHRTLRNVQNDLDEARSVGRGEVGFLNIGFVGSAMLTSIPNLLREYRKTYPKVELHLHESFTSQVVRGLVSGTLDSGFLRDGDRTPELEVTPLFSERYVAVLPAHHPRAGQRTILIASLRDEPFVFYSPGAGTRAFDKPISMCVEQGFHPRIVQEASHWLTILRLIGAGLGVSIAPACVGKISSPETVCLPIRGTKVLSEIEIAHRVGEDRPIVQSFAAMAKESFLNATRPL